MAAQRIDGKLVAQKVQREVAEGLDEFRAEHGRVPALHVILVGDDPSSAIYVRNKDRALTALGMKSEVLRLASDTSEADLLAHVAALNASPQVDGILVQLPLPAAVNADRVVQSVDPAKDVDGLTLHNAGLLALGRPTLAPCTPLGCIRLLDEVGCKLPGARALVIGRSALVGRPIAQLLLARDATVTVAHSRTRNLEEVVASADVLVSAAGRAGLVKGEWVKPGAVVIDVGQNRDAQNKLCGDVEVTAFERASYMTPVPGGVGPMTVAMLAANTLEAAKRRVAQQ
jgi:methylenetetrahydrofolate dehydrogenase (NADP+) / methenyltetrahydrofolate cyclohydrolase